MRKLLTWGILIIVLCSIAYMVNGSFEKIQKKKEMEQKLIALPKLNLVTLDSLDFDAQFKSNKPVVLIHFNTSCEHCHYEISAIQEFAEEFKNSEVIFFSTETLSVIRSFANSIVLKEHSNIHFTKVSFTNVTDVMGTLSIPHIFVYGPDKKLRKEFKGETKPEAILKYLR